ncbi:hypothetical protein [Sphingomonas aerolata]|uniref:hypothetical protein n=1 Tax=Sphingomonas aerolata TaxID=185951 RepID=UPI002FDFC66A
MTDADQHSGGGERGDLIGGDAFGRERQHDAAAAGTRHQFHQIVVEILEARRIMDALAGRTDDRTLDMNADHARHVGVDRGVDRIERARSRRRVSPISVTMNAVVP